MSNTHGGNVHAFATQQQIGIDSILDFSANINPIGLSTKGVEALLQALGSIVHYPDPKHMALRNAISESYQMPENTIVIGNGAAEIMYALCRIEAFQGAYVPAPGFSEYALAASAANIPVQSYFLQLEDSEAPQRSTFLVPYEDLIRTAHCLEGPHLFFIGNPNNPDGSLTEPAHILQLACACESSGSFVVVDESFIDFTDQSTSVRQACLTHPSVIIIHSLTKAFAIPGLRLGVAYASPPIKEAIDRQIPTWSVNQLAQVYATAALGDMLYRKETRVNLETEKTWLLQALSDIPTLHIITPSVNFILLRLKNTTMTVPRLQEKLQEKCILIRSCEAYDGLGDGWFRIAIKLREDNQQLVDALKEIL